MRLEISAPRLPLLCGLVPPLPKDTDSLLLGVDLGTSAIKAVIHRVDGSIVSTASQDYQYSTPEPSIVEVPASRYWSVLVGVVRAVLSAAVVDPRHIAAMALSTQGETLVPVMHDGTPLRNAIVWLDNRAISEAAELSDRFGRQRLHQVTGQPAMLPTWPAAKVLWLRRNEPRLFEQVGKILLLEDYINFKLTGEYVCEGSLATSTCYWELRERRWWPPMLEAIELDASQLPSLVEPGSVIGRIMPTPAEELGLTGDTVVVAGALDQACGAIGVGNVARGLISENTGSAVAICAMTDGPQLDPQMRLPTHYHGIPGHYMFHTFTAGGVVLRWLREQFCEAEHAKAIASGQDVYDVMTEGAEAVKPGCDGLIVLPHLEGAMAPELNPSARGAVLGLSLNHTKNHLIRAALEAIAFVVRRNIEVLENLGIRVDGIRALGGGARSGLWKQIEADVTKRPVYTTNRPEAATLGACVLAGLGVGLYSSVGEAASGMVTITRTFEPEPRRFGVYDDNYRAYCEAFEALYPRTPAEA